MIRNFIINTLAVGIVFYILPSVNIMGNTPVEKIINIFVISIILGALNLVVRPILGIISLPINILTLGLFGLILNALMIKIADIISNSFEIIGFVNYFIFALLLSIVNIIFGIFKSND